jgi:hypothetical protein
MKEQPTFLRRLSFSALLLLLMTTATFPSDALAYHCTDHCYGIVDWVGGIDGAATNIVVDDTYMNDGMHFITNEMWVVQDNGSDCYVDGIPSGGTDWVEVGMMANLGNYYYFNANCPPGGVFVRNRVLNVPGGDWGIAPYFEINETYWGNYNAYIYSPTLHAMSYNFSNTMTADHIHIGEELFSSSGGWSNRVDWLNNQYIIGGSYFTQLNGGHTMSEPPIMAYWVVTPAPGGTGGDWYAVCPCGS